VRFSFIADLYRLSSRARTSVRVEGPAFLPSPGDSNFLSTPPSAEALGYLLSSRFAGLDHRQCKDRFNTRHLPRRAQTSSDCTLAILSAGAPLLRAEVEGPLSSERTVGAEEHVWELCRP